MKRTAGVVLLALLALSPIHGKEELSNAGERYRYAANGIADAAQKIRCLRTGVHLDIWQSRLKLNDWDIQLSCASYSRIPIALGVTEWMPEERRARMWINTESDKKDPEEVVIHELIHLVIGETRVANSVLIDEQTALLIGGMIYKGRAEIK